MLNRQFYRDRGGVYRAAPLESFGWLEHGFGTRISGDWITERPHCTLKQVHSAKVVTADGGHGCLGEGDAMVSNTPGALLTIRTADCLPLLLADPENRAIGAVHAGWRGAVDGVVLAAVQAMGQKFGTRPDKLHAAVGPGIGACCFAVGPEVACRFRAWFPERDDLDGATTVDLEECVTRQLLSTGIVFERIYRASLCTSCHPGEFHSWRRNRQPARMHTAIGIRARQTDSAHI